MSGRYMLHMLPTVFPSFCIVLLWPFQEYLRRVCQLSADFVLVPSSSCVWIRRVCHPSKRRQLLVSTSRQGINIPEDLDLQEHRYDSSNQSVFSFGTRLIFAGVLLKSDGRNVFFLHVFLYLGPYVWYSDKISELVCNHHSLNLFCRLNSCTDMESSYV